MSGVTRVRAYVLQDNETKEVKAVFLIPSSEVVPEELRALQEVACERVGALQQADLYMCLDMTDLKRRLQEVMRAARRLAKKL